MYAHILLYEFYIRTQMHLAFELATFIRGAARPKKQGFG